jgi:hypothetical protein
MKALETYIILREGWASEVDIGFGASCAGSADFR